MKVASKKPKAKAGAKAKSIPKAKGPALTECRAPKAARNKVIDTAIERLTPRDAWLQGTLHDTVERFQSFCLIGAVLGPNKETAPPGTKNSPANLAVTAIAQSIPKRELSRVFSGTDLDDDVGPGYGFTHGAIFHWNDDYEVTKRKVLNALRRAKKQPLVIKEPT